MSPWTGLQCFPVRIRGTVTRRAYGSRNLFVGVSWKREDCWNGGDLQGFFGLCHGMRLFQLQSIGKIQLFSPIFPFWGFMAGALRWLCLWDFKKHQLFSATRLFVRLW